MSSISSLPMPLGFVAASGTLRGFLKFFPHIMTHPVAIRAGFAPGKIPRTVPGLGANALSLPYMIHIQVHGYLSMLQICCCCRCPLLPFLQTPLTLLFCFLAITVAALNQNFCINRGAQVAPSIMYVFIFILLCFSGG